MIQHARSHGAVGYTPHRNLDEMRLDWTRSQDVTSTGTPISSQHVPQVASPLPCHYNTSDRRSLNGSTFCVDCETWKRTTEFRRGASTCSTCLRIPCSACGKKKRQLEYRTGDVYNFLTKKINARCQRCRQRGRRLGGSKHKQHKGEHCRECRCTRCGVYQGSSAFRRTKEGRVDVCRTCELVPCATCGAMLPRGNFTNGDIYKYFAGTKHVTCLLCREHQQHRLRQLQKLMKTSKRKACTCRHPQQHTKSCPLSGRFTGEKPYPGCDVMSRADSEWFLEQRKKKKIKGAK